MLDPQTIQMLAPVLAPILGAGGIVSIVMFFIYRKDALAFQESWREQAQERREDTQMVVQVIKENTVAITALTERLGRR